LETYLQNVTLSIPPLVVDTVFVADSVTSFLSPKKVLFCLGANSGVLPVALNDIGIIRDDEINKLEKFAKLSPTVATINKRNKLLLYEKLLKATKLYVSFLSVNEKNEQLIESSFVSDLVQMFDCDSKEFYHDGDFLLNNSAVQNSNLAVFNNPNLKVATNNFISSLKDWYYFDTESAYFKNLNVLKNLLVANNVDANNLIENLNYKNFYDKIDNAKELFFGKDTTSVSQFESYFACPFKHFLEYGIKLKENTSSEIGAQQFGFILHEFVAKIITPINEHKNQLTAKTVATLASEVMNKVLSNKQYDVFVSNAFNYNAIEALKEEAVRIANALLQMEQQSTFVPKKQESRFGTDKANAIAITTESGLVYLNGVIDRVDYNENEYRIIDYKSGLAEFNSFTEIASGKKLQLFVYIKAEKKQDNVCVGAFYLPLKNDFMKNGDLQDLYKLKGVIANKLSTICAMDNTLLFPQSKSKILPLSRNKDGEFSSTSQRYLLSVSDIEWLSNYAIKLIEVAYKKVVSGDITPHPLKLDKNGAHTSNIGLSNFNLLYGNSFREVEDIKNFDKQKLLFSLNIFNENDSVEFSEDFTLKNKK
jgi:ATP-dependent helicase/nuclease subunit B